MNENVKITVDALEKNGFEVRYFETIKEAKESLVSEIKVEETVGFGGSVGLEEIKLINAIRDKGISAYYHTEAKNPEERKAMITSAAMADVYICTSNAVTKDGRLVNIDGTGNRLSSMLFGHERLYIVCGINKLAENYEEAVIRIKNEIASQNAKRLGRKTPCAVTGKCGNCNSEDRICNATLVMDRKIRGIDEIIIYIVNEKLGY